MCGGEKELWFEWVGVAVNLVKVVRKEFVMFFFFQAEDGIRDYKVTGVQTCALPIFSIMCR